LTASGNMNMFAWDLFTALKSLNKACEAKHGKGHTWGDVDLFLKANFKKQC